MQRKLRFGMLGGGEGAFIGDVHRKAAQFFDKSEIVAGCFSRNEENNQRTGALLRLNPERVYADYREMAKAEGARADKIDFVIIVTPNALHHDMAAAFMREGIHVVCDKPMTTTMEDALSLQRMAKERDILFGVSHAYTYHPMATYARQLIQSGAIGEIYNVHVSYLQGWLTTDVEHKGDIQMSWRVSPELTGRALTMGDIGTHAFHIVEFMSGLKIKRLSAKLQKVGGRKLDTLGNVLCEYENGASGMYWVSQVAHGHQNDLRIQLFGEKGSIEWTQEDPETLLVTYVDTPTQILKKGYESYLGEHLHHLPAGHAEGFYEAFANYYDRYQSALMKKLDGQQLSASDLDFANLEDGLRGVAFINRCVDSTEQNSAWVDFSIS